jgi:hypothetical protein
VEMVEEILVEVEDLVQQVRLQMVVTAVVE